MNWIPINNTPEEGYYDLWCLAPDGERMRVVNCLYKDSKWSHSIGNITWKITHYAYIVGPQEELDWPDKDGWWWVISDGPISCSNVAELTAESARFGSFRHDKADTLRVGWKFLPSPIPILKGGEMKVRDHLINEIEWNGSDNNQGDAEKIIEMMGVKEYLDLNWHELTSYEKDMLKARMHKFWDKFIYGETK